ncbi:MAG: hypothetical protein BWY59_00014 [Verrucomicrobia bacterium ADurb.Bin345]|nr:MAG: hypothetical protein BWY59_00014 [Verrucomicrobia bacterium ADurb.Bin345]
MKIHFPFYPALVCLLSLSLAAADEEASDSEISVAGPDVVSLGRIPCHQVQRVTFKLVNRSGRPVRIRDLKPTCSCLKGECDKKTVQPGEEFAVTLRLDPYEIKGEFQRSLWVTASGRHQQRIKLTVEGEAVPPFTVQPPPRIHLRTLALGVAWTNVHVLSPSEKGLTLGAPVFETNADFDVSFNLSTDRSGTNGYQAKIVMRPRALGKHQAVIRLPVEGRTNMPPVQFSIQARAGLELSAAPGRLLLPHADQPVVRRLLIHTEDEAASGRDLRWEPQVEGLEVKVGASAKAGNLAVELRFSPEAVRQVLALKTPALTFHYTSHAPVAVSVFQADKKTVPDAAHPSSLRHVIDKRRLFSRNR